MIETSHHTPVLVDFWAPWCGPCRALGPTLDKLASETTDWTLVKVNTDEHPEISQRYGIRGIPAVKLFHRGAVVGEFTGALPEAAVRQWLAGVLPSEARRLVQEAQPLLDAGLLDEARPLLEQAYAADPTLPEARLGLAHTLAFSDRDRALSLLEGPMPAGAQYGPLLEAIRTLAAFQGARTEARLPDGPGQAPFADALDAVHRHDFDAAIAAVLDGLQRDRYYFDDALRRLGVALFTLLGPGHEVTQAYRRRFSMLLY